MELTMCVCHDQYGRAALEAVLKAVTGQGSPMIPPPQDYKGHFFQGMLIFDVRDTDKSRYFALTEFNIIIVLSFNHHVFFFMCKSLSDSAAKRSAIWLQLHMSRLHTCNKTLFRPFFA